MDAPVDFSLDRARILNGNITASSYNGSSFNDTGRASASGLGSSGSLQDLSRGSGTPASSADYHSRFFHPGNLALASQGTSTYAMMHSYLHAGGAASEHLKALLPEYYAAQSEGLSRYLMSSGSLIPHYLHSYLSATDSLSMYAHNAGPSAYHRIYDLHKEAALYHAATGAGLYSPPSSSSTSRPGRLPAEHISNVPKRDSKSCDTKRSLDLSKQSTRNTETSVRNRNAKDYEKKEEKRALKRSCDLSPGRTKKVKTLNSNKSNETENKQLEKDHQKDTQNSTSSFEQSGKDEVESTDEKKITRTESLVDLSIKIPNSESQSSVSKKLTSPSESRSTDVESPVPTEKVVPSEGQTTLTTTTTTTFSLPYYHSIYSHSQPSGTTDGKKVHAPTFTPEIVTLPSIVTIPTLPVQTMACDMRIKKEKSSSSYSCCNPSSVTTSNTTSCQISPKIREKVTVSPKHREPLELTQTDSQKKRSKEKQANDKTESSELIRKKQTKKNSDSSLVLDKLKSVVSASDSLPKNNSDATETSLAQNNQLVENKSSSRKAKDSTASKTDSTEEKINDTNVNSQEKQIPSTSVFNTETEVVSNKPSVEETDDKGECQAINLVKEKHSSPNNKEGKSENETAKKEDMVDKKLDQMTTAKKRMEKSAGKRQSGKLKSNHDESLGMSSIPIGIAVAQKREEQKSDKKDVLPDGSINGTVLTDAASRQHGECVPNVSNTRTVQKSPTPNSTIADMRNQLPANLIVTGSANGTGVAWTDDPTTRHFTPQWLQTGPAPLGQSTWLGQMPFAINSSIPTTNNLDGNQMPLSIPPGYKLIQDSVTGQLLLIPTTSIDMYDANRLWAFPGTHPTQIQQVFTAQHASLPPQVITQHTERQPTDFPIGVSYQEPIQNVYQNCRDDKKEIQLQTKSLSTPSPLNCDTTKTDSEKNTSVQKTKPILPKEEVPAAKVLPTSSQVGVPVAYTNAIVKHATCDVSDAIPIKSETSHVQSRGTSPMITGSECEDAPQDKIDATHQNNEVKPPEGANTSSKGVSAVQIQCVQKTIESETKYQKDNSVENVETSKTTSEVPENSSAKTELPNTTVIGDVTIVEMTPHRELLPKDNSNIPPYLTDECEAQKPPVEVKTDSNNTYNPFLDPQILQAADGLELLSALAEQRVKFPQIESEKEHVSKPENTCNDNVESEKEKIKIEQKESKPAIKQVRKKSISRTRSIPPTKQACKAEGGSYYTSTGLRIPQGEEEINAIELDMRIRLAELQRQYKEKQKQFAKLQPKKNDKDKDNRNEDKQRGPGRPRKRQHNSGSSSESNEKTSPTKTKEPPVKKKKQAEELVDRVFRKTGGGFGMPLSKKLKANAMAALFKTQSGFTMKRKGSASGSHAITKQENEYQHEKTGFTKSSQKEFNFKVKDKYSQSEEKKQKSGKKSYQKHNLFGSAVKMLKKMKKSSSSHERSKEKHRSKYQDGLSMLASFALTHQREHERSRSHDRSHSSHKKQKEKRKKEEKHQQYSKSEHSKNKTSEIQNPLDTLSATTKPHATNNQEPKELEKESKSDFTSPNFVNKKRKPGRPRKCTPDQSESGTETIVDKTTKNFRLYQLQNLKQDTREKERKIKLENQEPMKPIFLDEEWLRRRSERIFLSDPSPQPSPNITPSTQTQCTKSNGQQSMKITKPQPSHAKLQKAKSIKELTQRVKKKYSKKFQKTPDRIERRPTQKKQPKSKAFVESDSSESESDVDNIPLSVLRERPQTPEPRSCSLEKDELVDGLRVLVFKDGLFYEGAVKAIRPPDVYGVVVDNARGNRPYIYSQEEILKDVILDVKSPSSRFLKEGTRICAYWSQQFSCLYPGTIAKASPNPHSDKASLNVEFDDGDSGRIPLDHIRMLPRDFPIVSYDPNPLFLLGKRRRHTTSDSIDSRKSERSESTDSKPQQKRGPGRPPKTKSDSRKDGDEEDCDVDVCGLDDDGNDVFSSVDDIKTKKDKENKSKQNNDNDRNKQSKKASTNKDNKQTDKSKEHSKEKCNKEPGKNIFYHNLDSLKKVSTFVKKTKDPSSSCLSMSKYASSDSETDTGEMTDTHGNQTSQSQLQDFYAFNEKDKSKKSNRYFTNESKPADFLPARQLWEWSGKSTKRPGMKGKAKKEFYRSIIRGKEHISVGECAVFLSTGRPHLPFVGRIDSMWEAWGGQMVVKVKWFYHPEETRGGKKLQEMKGALFQSPHFDENDVQTISHKCDVLSYTEYTKTQRTDHVTRETAVYYLAGTYEPTIGLLKFEEDVM